MGFQGDRRKPTKLPYMQFYPADWLQDTQVLTLEAQGAWIKLLCAMWTAPTRGIVCWGYRKFEAFWGKPRGDVEMLINDIANVADVSLRDSAGMGVNQHENAVDVIITCRRMVREEAQRKREATKKYRQRHGDVPRDVPQNVPSMSPRIYQKSDIRSQNKNKTPIVPKGDDGGFTQNFWNPYPKKVGKRACLRSWKRLRPSIELQEKIKAAIEKQKNSEQWKKNLGQYIPNPATWLNQGRWDDEIDDFLGIKKQRGLMDEWRAR